MNDESPRPDTNANRESFRIKFPGTKPIATFVLIGISIAFFILQTITETISGYDLLFLYGGKINSLITAGQVWRLITPVLLHGSILHIAMNMYALYILGRRMERFYGHKRFLLLYLISGFAGNVLSFVLTDAPSLGASTAIFGLFAAEGIFIIQNRKLFGSAQTRQALMNLGIVLIINMVYGFAPGSNIDIMGHIGGLIGGAFFAWKAGPILGVTGEPPFFDMIDKRKKKDVTLASVVVLVGFTIIALIPFITG
ncbi:MAG: rhomboid family intramembrane serine protease [Brevefilum sp.]|nr:rhomboid family intramembrane serine protease [Brevefilum sp.]